MTTDLPVVLVIDDEIRSQETIRRVLGGACAVLTASSAREAETVLERDCVHVILCDQRMPGTTGVEFLSRARQRWPDIVRIIISGYTDTEDIIAGINDAGIYQYITKPWQPEALMLSVRNAADLFRLQIENQRYTLEMRPAEHTLRTQVDRKQSRLRSLYAFDTLIFAPDSPLQDICETAARIAPYDLPVLVTGESGTGKELLARAIHYTSPRADRVFVIENCGALSDQILESELFGHKRGAFTGAYEDRVGLIEEADGGTILLDEIGETSQAFQVKLLRVLQEGEIRPLGSSRSRRVDVRVISATNRDLEEEVRRGRFREDLYYRLAALTLHIPPLRGRVMDIPPLARSILDDAMRSLGKTVSGLSAQALECLCAYHWPGNVRELKNELLRALALCDGDQLDADGLSPRVLQALPAGRAEDDELGIAGDGSLKDRLEVLEASILKETLIRNHWNKSRAAQELGVSRVGLRSKLQRHNLEPKR